MFLNCDSAVEKKSRGANSWHCGHRPAIFIAAFALCLFRLSTVFGQMGQSAVYSDQWVDSSNPAAIKIVGSGVTQDNQNYYGHTYWVVTTVTSPSGRTATSTSYQSSSYAHVETYLPWDWDDSGNYFVETRHWMCCPYMGGNPYTGQGCYPSSTTSANPFYGASKAQYVNVIQYGDGSGGFVPIAGCNVACMPPSFVQPLYCSGSLEYKLRLQVWLLTVAGKTCLPGTIVYVTRADCTQQLAQCYEASTP